MSFNTGRCLNHNNATPLTMPIEVIDHVHRIAHHAPFGITFTDRNNVAFLDISYDDEVVDLSDYDSENSDNDNDPSEAADPEDSVDVTGENKQ